MNVAIPVILAVLGATAIYLIFGVLSKPLIEYYAEQLRFGLPWMRWFTIEDVTKMGYWRFLSEHALCHLYKEGELEVQPRDDVDEDIQTWVETKEFRLNTISFYQFRISYNRRRRKQQKRTAFQIPRGLSWGWRPFPA